MNPADLEPYLKELDNLYEDASYSAQTYFEAAKSAEMWGKAIVFIPALVRARKRIRNFSKLQGCNFSWSQG
jgi:hypothetical protein